MIDFTRFKVMSFDCYGTLIDWETGIVNAMRPILENHNQDRGDEEILDTFSRIETVVQQSSYMRYEDVLGQVADECADQWGFALAPAERAAFSRSVENWPAFPDSASALSTLGNYYDLVILSNVDDDLFAAAAAKLGAAFTDVITAEQVRSYKPDQRNFEVLLDRINVPAEMLLHVAQSLYHDIAPANRIGLTSVWVNRRAGKDGGGATPPADATPDLEVPDLATLAAQVEQAFSK